MAKETKERMPGDEKLLRGMTKEAFLWMDHALGLSANLIEALQPLIPDPSTLSPELRDKWQKVVEAIFDNGNHADTMPDCLKEHVQ
jgi:hypothetical protein